MAPDYDDLVKELQAALDTIKYLAPEKYDDEQRKAISQGEIARVQALIDASRHWRGRQCINISR